MVAKQYCYWKQYLLYADEMLKGVSLNRLKYVIKLLDHLFIKCQISNHLNNPQIIWTVISS
jgi:hypothetical protein